ncbi:DMT family transporter [Streptomyces sp. NRRL B-24484]|uniref:DMT family transporter n=1 Tax=Streptomyces sp. NRRL B-24484 TaxID=1463833 RepID=UPI0004BEF1B9|nr:DMT family transporter [Streptomyces sp. NRRL B-24484]
MSQLLALAASLLWGMADYGGGSLTRRLPAPTVVVASQAAAAVLLVVAVLATGGPGAVSADLWYAVAAGVVGPFALLAFYRALALGPMGVVSPLATVGVAVPVGLGLLLGERPGPAQAAGIAVAVLGVALAGGPRRGGGTVGVRVLALTLSAALGMGTVMALIARASDGGGLLLVLCVQRLCNVAVGGAVLLAGRGGRVPGAPGTLRQVLPALTVVGVADVAANGAFAAASHHGSVAVAAVLASLYPVVTALMARGLLKERLRRVQVLGAGLAVAGTLLLAAG